MKSVRKMLGSGSIMGKPSTINTECPICYELLANEPSIETPCRHKFHRRCLRTWCNTPFQSSCPICREPIIATCATLNQEPQIQPAPIPAPIILPTNNTDYAHNTDVWDPIYIQDMIQSESWEPVFYDTWMRTGQPNTDHVTSLDVSELGDMLPFSDGHIVQLDIERICTGFPNLRILKLNGNNLTSIPACIGTLRNLEFLDLANNNIPAHEVEAIFANPYWNDKSVSIKADNVTFDNNNLPYRFFISNNGSLRSNNRSTRSRVAPPQNAGKKRRRTKRKRSTKRCSRRRTRRH